MLSKKKINEFAIARKNNIIIILSDSLSMPSPDQGMPYTLTYPHLLNELLDNKYKVINRGMRLNTIQNQSIDQNVYDDILFLSPKYAIIQLGINDCAPRLFNRRIRTYFLSNLRPLWLQEKIIKIFSVNRLFFTKYFPKSYVTKVNFEKYYNYLVGAMIDSNIKPILINIAKTSKRNEERSYNFDKNIHDYNKIILKISKKYSCKMIDIYSYSKTNDILLSDGIHYNKNGSQLVAKNIYSIISKL